jgi:hypothetical protein
MCLPISYVEIYVSCYDTILTIGRHVTVGWIWPCWEGRLRARRKEVRESLRGIVRHTLHISTRRFSLVF